jgi:hypothetical protein
MSIILFILAVQALGIVITLFLNKYGIYGSGTWFGKIPYLTSKEK